jgi:prepilin-type N-terminal cleavage/methylation domain-containing protein
MITLQPKTYNLKPTRPGFTVIEMIITMAVFSIVLGVIIQIFIFTSRTQRSGRSVQEAYAEARVVVETMSREIQNGSIDYSYYTTSVSNPNLESLTAAVNVAALRDSQGQAVRFRCVNQGTDDLCDPSAPITHGQIQVCRGSGCSSENNSWAPLTDDATYVTGWRVWLGPAHDPFQRDPDYDPINPSPEHPSQYMSEEQPWLTAVISVLPRPVSGQALPEVRLQSTVSSRTYLR